MWIFNYIFGLLLIIPSCGQETREPVIPAADRSEIYLPLIFNKSVGIVANHSSLVNGHHLVDFLLAKEIDIARIFSPEHGFRGMAGAGESVMDGRDKKTGLEIISLYGDQKKPRPTDLKGIDMMIFDLQDVGVRFYTYISTLHYVMEACAENNIPLLLLDRPNPNANYIDGPVLEPEYSSFVGLHPVPVVYGMTIAEYAKMINGEKWLREGIQCELQIVKCDNYNHSSRYVPPVKPSPNLPDYLSIRLYPSLCFFEGTAISVGRGTDYPFQVFGHPGLETGDFYFTPESRPGAAPNPKLKGKKCRGIDLRGKVDPHAIQSINLEYLIHAYTNFPNKEKFFNPYFTKLSGTENLQQQITKRIPPGQIRISWQKDLDAFKKIRNKYLIYY